MYCDGGDVTRAEDHEHTPLVVCPWCGQAHEDCDEWHEVIALGCGEHECDKCGRQFEYEVHITVTYSTTRMHGEGEVDETW